MNFSCLKKVWQLPAFLITIIAFFDQWTKSIITRSDELYLGGSIEVVPDLFHIVYVQNTGAAWGIMSDSPELLTWISGTVFALMIIYFRKFTSDLPERCLAISFILGGIVGNFIDRISRQSVTDFLSFTYKSFEWPAFNIADSAICIGVIIYTTSSFLRPDSLPEDDLKINDSPLATGCESAQSYSVREL